MESLLRIRNREIWPNVIPSPMSGVTDLTFRRLYRELAKGRIGMSVTEFVSVDAARVLHPKQIRNLRFDSQEDPVCIQIFGGQTDRMAQGAREVESLGASFIEINAGCPMPKVIGKGGGSNLLRDLPRLQKILQQTRAAVSVPLFLKLRVGWDDDHINVLETLHMAQEEGIELLTIHGRTRMQGYRGLANWDLIQQAAQQATIPVVGNGDIHSAQEAAEKLEHYSVQGVGIGRALMHNPWIMGQVADLWQGLPVQQPSAQEQRQMVMRYLDLLREDGFHESGALGRLKQIVARMFRYIEPDISEARKHLLRSEELTEFLDRLQSFYEFEYKNLGACFVPGRIQSLNGKNELGIIPGNQFRK